jgi:hypothetical protein
MTLTVVSSRIRRARVMRSCPHCCGSQTDTKRQQGHGAAWWVHRVGCQARGPKSYVSAADAELLWNGGARPELQVVGELPFYQLLKDLR